jgi:hypothetical protein
MRNEFIESGWTIPFHPRQASENAMPRRKSTASAGRSFIFGCHKEILIGKEKNDEAQGKLRRDFQFQKPNALI